VAGLADLYDEIRRLHDPQVLLEGSGSFGVPARDEPAAVEGGPPGPATSSEPTLFLPDDVVRAQGRRWFAVVDGRGLVDLRLTEWPDPAWAGWHALVLTSRAAPAAHLQRLRDRRIPYLAVGADRVDLRRALDLLGSHLGVRVVVCTGGGRLGGALLRAGLVDEVDVDVLPAAIGGRGTPALFDAPPLRPDELPARLRLLAVDRVSGDVVRLRYAVAGPPVDPPPGP
jgi:riboflavin biosynthesis pyrimidine reductase